MSQSTMWHNCASTTVACEGWLQLFVGVALSTASTLKDEDLCGGSNGMADLVKDLLDPGLLQEARCRPSSEHDFQNPRSCQFPAGSGPKSCKL